MVSPPNAFQEAGAAGSSSATSATSRSWMVTFLPLSAGCGLIAGLFEVGSIVVRKRFFDSNHLYGMSRHFVWLVPLTNVGLFLMMGLFGCLLGLVWPRGGRWLSARFLCALALLPMVLIAFPRVYSLAALVMALGVASRLVPLAERKADGLRRLVRAGIPIAAVLAIVLGLSPAIGDRSRAAGDGGVPMRPSGSRNVVLIVMDTVAGGHTSLQGYDRATTASLVELADRAIRFDRAQAPSSWTLPSHASMFTGRWLHELSVGWLSPLDETYPTLAEYLGANGYATAGFIANTTYCARDSGLARGFTSYHDYIFPDLSAFRTAVLINRALSGMQSIVQQLDDRRELVWLRSYLYELWRRFFSDRKGAAVLNREFIEWFERRTQPERPFFAFLNYFDAHCPYRLEPKRMRRFGAAPTDSRQRGLIQQWADLDKARLSPRDVAFASDAYDDCVADLDEQVGKLLDDLKRRGVLEHTWLFITSDHGESFGEHAGVFCQGMSLYQTELHVPLLVIPPGGTAKKQVVAETVSLRDLAATVIDVLGLAADSPVPGNSLARFWNAGSSAAPPFPAPSDPVLAEVVPGDAAQRRWIRHSAKDLAAGGLERTGVVVHPPGGRRPRGVIRLGPGQEPRAQPGCRPNCSRDSRPNAQSPGPPDGRSARSGAIQSLNISSLARQPRPMSEYFRLDRT